MGLSVSEHGITDDESRARSTLCATEEEVYERLGLAYIEPELREGRGEIAGGGARASCRSWSSSTTSAATCTATRRSPTAATRSRRWPRRRASAATPTWRSPTTRPATGSATTSPPSALLRSGSRRSRACNAGAKRGFRLLAGSEVNILPDGSLDYDPRTCSTALDWVVASVHTSFSDLGEADDRAGDRRDREPAGRLHRPPDRAADRPARALRDRRRGGRRGRRRAPGRCSRSTATRTAATSPSATPGSPPTPG